MSDYTDAIIEARIKAYQNGKGREFDGYESVDEILVAEMEERERKKRKNKKKKRGNNNEQK